MFNGEIWLATGKLGAEVEGFGYGGQVVTAFYPFAPHWVSGHVLPGLAFMGRGRKSLLGADKLAYLESHFPEFQELQPNLGRFWMKVERGWNEKWPVELDLGLPMLSMQGVLIEDTGVPVEHQVTVGEAQEKNKTRTRKLHRVELWQKRNPEVLEAALKATEYHELMGSSDEWSTRIKTGRSAMLKLQKRVRTEEFEKASEEEKAAVEAEFAQQEHKKTGLALGKAETPEEFQDRSLQGIGKAGAAVEDIPWGVGGADWMGGWDSDDRADTEPGCYCHSVTPAGHTLDQAIAGWDDNVVVLLQQFGKKLFVPESEVTLDSGSAGVSGHADDRVHSNGVGEPPTEDHQKCQRKKKSKKKSKQAAEPSAYIDAEGAAIPPAASFFNESLAGRSSEDHSAGDWWNNDDWRAEDSIPAELAIDPALEMALYASPPVHPAAVGLYTFPTVDPMAEMSLHLSPPATRPKPRPAHRRSLFGRLADDPAAPFELTSLSADSATMHSDLSAFVSNFVYPPPTPSADSSAAPCSPVPTPSAPVSPSPGSQTTLSKPAVLSMPTYLATAHPATGLSRHGSPGPGAPTPRSPATAPSTPASAATPTPLPPPQAPGTPVVQTCSTPAPAATAAGTPTPQSHARGTPGVGSRPSSSSSVTAPSPLRVVYTATAAPTGPMTSPSHPARLAALDVGIAASATPASTPLVHVQAVTMTMTTPATRLSHDNFPKSRPMCNPPLVPKPAKPAQGSRGGRRGACGGGGRGRGGRGGGSPGGGARGGESSTDAGEGSGDAGEGSGDAGEGSTHTPVESHAADGCFLQTYDALGNIVPLPLGTRVDTIPAAWKREIREMEKKRDASEEKARKARKKRGGDGKVCPSAKVAECEPQRRRTMAEIRAEAAAKKSAKDPPTKRKADVENEHPRLQKRRKCKLGQVTESCKVEKQGKGNEDWSWKVTEGSYVELSEGKGGQTISDALSGNVPSREPNTNSFESADGKAGVAGREARAGRAETGQNIWPDRYISGVGPVSPPKK
ncbi:hypothetical protein B0H10DRAFT_1963766 [Mycena sp. CBHHK59/15]|nr:hypothetical protein B0H10DRAFT_1963766 [Mycena sp. CBHHK59/15]